MGHYHFVKILSVQESSLDVRFLRLRTVPALKTQSDNLWDLIFTPLKVVSHYGDPQRQAVKIYQY